MNSSIWAKCWVIGALAILGAQTHAAESVAQLRAAQARVTTDAKTGAVRFIGFDAQTIAGQAPNQALRPLPASAAADQHLARYASLFGLGQAASETKLIKHVDGRDGQTMTRYQQHYQGIPVIAGELIVNQTSQRQLTSISGKTAQQLKLSTIPRYTAAQAKAIALQAMVKWYPQPVGEFVVSEPVLSIYDSRLMSPDQFPAVLVWRMAVTTKSLQAIDEFIAVDAGTGAIPIHFNQVPHAKNRLTYDAANTSNLPGTLVCDETHPNTPACLGGNADALAAHRWAGATYDYYWTNFGRDSIDGAGMPIISTTHGCDTGYGSCPMHNAFWKGTQMVFGAGYALAEDIAAHEMTHGVTDAESKLSYFYQSGAINESLSDVFGEFIQQSDLTGTAKDSTKWLIEEDCCGHANEGATRNLKNPTWSDPEVFANFPKATRQPDRMTRQYYLFSSGDKAGDNGGVHTNSGVNNKAAYLMVEGGSFNGRNITGLGLYKAGQIYYRAQIALLTSGSDYLDLHNALYQSCQDLVGGTAGIVAADCQSVQNATLAVEMNLPPKGDAGFSPDASICPVGQSVMSTLFSDDFESGTANWTLDHTAGSENWINFDLYASSGTHSMEGVALGVISDMTMSMLNPVKVPANAHLWFSHAFNFQGPNYDGVY